MAAARQVLMMMTGWSFPYDTIDSAARTLRFPAIRKEIWRIKSNALLLIEVSPLERV
jgi:hypothetical protein